MKRTTLSFFTAALASLALVGCHGGGSGGGGSDLASVNGEAIGMDEFHTYLERKPVVIVQTNSGPAELPVVQSLGFQAMRDLINRRVLLQIAKDDGVYPTADAVAKELDFQKKRDAQFIPKLQAQGLTLEDIRRDLTLDLAKENIVTKGITVTPADADKFIQDNPEKFMSPEQAKLRLIAVHDEAAKKQVDTDLSGGQPFQQVALHYSTAQNVRQTQGLYQVSVVSQMPPELQEIVKTTAEGKDSPWKQFGTDWVKFRVEQKVPAKKIPIDDMIKETVRRSLAMDRGNQATDLSKRLVDKLRNSKVAVDSPSLKGPWDIAFKSLQDSDVQANTRTGAAGATAGGATAGSPAPAGPPQR